MRLNKSMKGILSLALVAVVSAFMFAVSPAQETSGSIQGTVSDATGARVPGVSIKIDGSNETRTATADADGFFRILRVPAGAYKVTVSSAAFSTTVVDGVIVQLGKTTPLEVSLKVGAVSEQVNISSESVVRIDPADNKIQTNISSRVVDALPKGMNMSSLLKVSPATRIEAKSGQFQVDGASGSENSFIIDGLEVSNFRTGVLNGNNNLPFQFIQEIQIKTSGFEAEFGGATGGVINVVTRGGSNEFHGEVGMQFEPNQLWAGPRPFLNSFRTGTGANFVQINEYLRPERDNFNNYFPTFGFGGPLKKDRLWFFAAYAPQIFNTKRTTRYYSPDPRTRTVTATEAYESTTRNEYFQGRLDAAPTNTLRLTATYTWNPIIVDGVLPTGNISLGGVVPSVNFGGTTGRLTGSQLTNRQGGRQNSNNVTTQAIWTPNSNFVASFRFSRGFLNERSAAYFIPQVTRFTCGGLAVPTDAGCALGFSNVPSNNNIFFDVSTRNNFEGDVSYIVNKFGGRHEIKGGYQNTKVTNDVSRGYKDLGVVNLSYGFTINDLTGRNDAVTPGSIGAGNLVRFGTVGKASNRAQSVYVQDRWQPFSRLSINAGIRLEKEDLPSFNGFAPPINFGWGDKIVPRLGGAFDPTGSGKSKIFFSFGQFTDRLKFELPRGSFGGDFYRVDYFEILPGNPQYTYYTPQRILGTNQDILGGKCPIPGTTGLSRCQYDYRIASNSPSADIYNGLVDPELKPYRQTEFTVGFEREFFSNYLLSVRYTNKYLNDAIEDAGFPTPEGSEAYIIGNPGKGLHAQVAKQFGYPKTTTPERRYDALEFKLDRRFSKNFFYQVNYTYSRLYGNYSGLASSDENGRTSPGVNRFFDLPHLGFTASGAPDNGRLATDRPHVVNAYGAYNFDWFGKAKGNETQFSFFTTAQSGTPLTSFYAFYAAAILYGRGNLGRTDGYTQTDFAIQHKFNFGASEQYKLTFEFNALNVFNESNILDNQTSYNAINPSIATLKLPVADEPAAINYILNKGVVNEFNAFLNDPTAPQRKQTALGMPITFQTGRAIRLGLRFTF